MKSCLALLAGLALVGCTGTQARQAITPPVAASDFSTILALAEAEALAAHPTPPVPAPAARVEPAPAAETGGAPQGATVPRVEPPPKPVAFSSPAAPPIVQAVYRAAQEPPVAPLPTREEIQTRPLDTPSAAPPVCDGTACAQGSCAGGACAAGACRDGTCLASGGPVRRTVGFFRDRRPVRRMAAAWCARRPVRRILGAPFRLFSGGCR